MILHEVLKEINDRQKAITAEFWEQFCILYEVSTTRGISLEASVNNDWVSFQVSGDSGTAKRVYLDYSGEIRLNRGTNNPNSLPYVTLSNVILDNGTGINRYKYKLNGMNGLEDLFYQCLTNASPGVV